MIKIDVEDEYILTKYRWREVNGYLATNDFHGGLVYLQRFLLGAKKGQKVEFINGDRKDYRRDNLRINNNIRWKNRPNKGILTIKGKKYRYKWENGKYKYIGKV